MLRSLLGSPYLALALAPLLWAGNLVVGKLLVDTLPPFTLSAVRWAIGALVLAPFVLRRPERLRIARRWWPHLVMLGVTGVALYSALLYAALDYTTTVNAALLQAAIPMATAAMAVTLLREPVVPRQWVGILVAFVGVAWIVSAGQPEALLSLSFNRGDLIMLVNVMLWAAYSIVAQRVLPHVDGLAATFLTVLIGLLWLLPVAAFESRGIAWPPLTVPLVLALVYLGVFPSILAYVLWNRGVAAVGAGRAALFTNVLPVYTAALAALTLGETIAVYHLVGGAAVAAGVFVGTRARG